MRKFFAATVGSVVALAGFAGAANASATIDLIWRANGTNQIGGITSPVFVSSNIVLEVILTAGPGGSAGAGVGADYSGAIPALSVIGYASTPSASLSLAYGTTTDTGSRIENFSSVAIPPSIGLGLPPGATARLGTVRFHVGSFPTGTFEIRSDATGLTDGVLDLIGDDITATTTFNSAFVTMPGTTPTATPTTSPTPTATPTPTPTPTPTTTPSTTPTATPTPTPSTTPSATPTPTPTTTPTATPSPTSNCCSPHGFPGCDVPGCEADVCAEDPFCCGDEEPPQGGSWDSICVSHANTLCPVCGGATTPTPTATPTPTPTPEPSAILQLLAGGVGLAFLRKRKMSRGRRAIPTS